MDKITTNNKMHFITIILQNFNIYDINDVDGNDDGTDVDVDVYDDDDEEDSDINVANHNAMLKMVLMTVMVFMCNNRILGCV